MAPKKEKTKTKVPHIDDTQEVVITPPPEARPTPPPPPSPATPEPAPEAPPLPPPPAAISKVDVAVTTANDLLREVVAVVPKDLATALKPEQYERWLAVHKKIKEYLQ